MDFSGIDAILELLGDSPVMPLFKDDVMDYLVMLKAMLIDPPREYRGKSINFDEDLKSLASKAESIICSFDVKKMNEFMAQDLCFRLLQLFVELDQRKLIRKFLRSVPIGFSFSGSFPRTSPFVFIKDLLENLEDLVKDTASTSSTRLFNHIILRLQRELRFWNYDLAEISRDPPSFLQGPIGSITYWAYAVEHTVELFLVGDSPSWECIQSLLFILQQFDLIDLEKRDGEDDEEDLKAKKNMIYDKLLQLEVEGGEQLNLVTIIGKSGMEELSREFTQELYDSPSVIGHFEIRAWCRTLYHDKRTLKLELLGHLVDPSNIECSDMNDEELSELLREYLKGHRFLLVIDMIYSASYINHWFFLQRCFPDSRNGSRIVVITEHRQFAFHAKSMKIVQPQSPEDADNWKIRKESLFQNQTCPPNLEEVWINIVKRCKHKPITAVLALLKRVKNSVNWWELIAKTLGSQAIGSQDEQLTRILKLSYMFLSDDKRSCFLYLTICLPYTVISVSKAIRLWIAERFIRKGNTVDVDASQMSLEEKAKDYVADLMALQLLQGEEKLIGGATWCQPNNLLRDFLLSKVVEENFLHRINGYDDFFQSSKDPNFSSSSTPTPNIYQQRCWCNYEQMNDFIMLKPSGPFLQSLFLYADKWLSSKSESGTHDLSFIFNKFKLLKILDIGIVGTEDSFFLGVVNLVLLRYLEVRNSIDSIPPTIANLWNLETFLFHGTSRKAVQVPDSIWDMTRLRHLHINESASFHLDPNRLDKSYSILDNLQTLSTPSFAYGDDMEKILRKLQGIRKLKCIFLDFWNDATDCNQFPELGSVNQLIALHVLYDGNFKYPYRFSFPSNLKKLTLSKFKMPWSEINQLAMLCHLEVLKLLVHATSYNKSWEMEDDVVFRKLKYLKLKNIYIVEWSGGSRQFPNLERLSLTGCSLIVGIPLNFAYINTICYIEVLRCTLSAENSAKLIKEENKKHWSNDKLQINLED